MRAVGAKHQNGLFATTHVTQTAYEHMCFQRRVALEEGIYTKALQRQLAQKEELGRGQEEEEEQEQQEGSRRPTTPVRPGAASPTSVRMSGGGKTKRGKSVQLPHAGRQQAKKIVAGKVQELKARAEHSHATPNVFESGNPATHQFEVAERRRHPHRPNLRTNLDLSMEGNARGRSRSRTPSRSPSMSPRGTGHVSPLFTAIRENAQARKAEERRLRREAKRRHDQHLRSTSPQNMFVADTAVQLMRRKSSSHKPNERLSEIQGFASDPNVTLAQFQEQARRLQRLQQRRNARSPPVSAECRAIVAPSVRVSFPPFFVPSFLPFCCIAPSRKACGEWTLKADCSRLLVVLTGSTTVC